MATETRDVITEEEHFANVGWFHRGELEQQLGIQQATISIESGKCEKAAYPDGDSMYCAASGGGAAGSVHRKTGKTARNVRHTSTDDIEKCPDALLDFCGTNR